MDKSTKYLNNVALPDLELDTDNVSYNEAIVACEIMRLETLKEIWSINHGSLDSLNEYLDNEVQKLTKKLRNIKY